MNELRVEADHDQLRRLVDGDVAEIRLPVAESGPRTTPIADLEMGNTEDIKGVIRSVDDIHEFDRSKGGTGQVRNIRLQDATGDIRVALWGDKASMEWEPGEDIHITNASIEDGFRDDIEASVGESSTITNLDADTDIEYIVLTIEGS